MISAPRGSTMSVRSFRPTTARQCVTRARRRRRYQVGDGSCRAVFRRARRRQDPPPVQADALASPSRSDGSCSKIESNCRGCTWPGIRRRSVRRRRCGAGSGRRSAGQRENVAPVSLAGLRRSDGDRDCGVAEFARAGRLLSNRRDGRARANAGGTGARDWTGASTRWSRKGPCRARWNVARRKPKRISCIGCRPSAGSAASPIS